MIDTLSGEVLIFLGGFICGLFFVFTNENIKYVNGKKSGKMSVDIDDKTYDLVERK